MKQKHEIHLIQRAVDRIRSVLGFKDQKSMLATALQNTLDAFAATARFNAQPAPVPIRRRNDPRHLNRNK